MKLTVLILITVTFILLTDAVYLTILYSFWSLVYDMRCTDTGGTWVDPTIANIIVFSQGGGAGMPFVCAMLFSLALGFLACYSIYQITGRFSYWWLRRYGKV
jgi:hypothetical protein